MGVAHDTSAALPVPPADYQAAQSGLAVFDAGTAGRLWLGDRDRADLLQRLSTNDILKLGAGQGTRTVLTNHNGRIIDLLTVAALPERLLLLCGPGQGNAVTRLLRKNIFFQDRVSVADATSTTCQFGVYGPLAATVLERLGATATAALPLFGLQALTLAGLPLFLLRDLPLGGQGFTLVAEREYAGQLLEILQAAGAAILSAAAYDTLRVEQGYGAVGHELSLEYIPLETGLTDAISFTKGCYVGQEIIARMDSRGRMAKRLRGLRLSAPIDAPRKLDVAGKEAGDLTSAVVSPRLGPIALAYVRSTHAEPGTVVGFAGSDVTAEVVALPFADGR